MSKKKVKPDEECPHGCANAADCAVCCGLREEEPGSRIEGKVKMGKKQKHVFPKQLYIVKEKTGNKVFFAAHESFDKIDVSEGRRIAAIYNLAEVCKLRTTFTMEPLLNDEK